MTGLLIHIFRAALTAVALAASNVSAIDVPVGPCVGHVGEDVAYLWYRPTTAGFYLARVWDEDRPDVIVSEAVAQATETDDLCCHFRLPMLSPGRGFVYGIYAYDSTFSESLIAGGQGSDCRFRTWQPAGSGSLVTLDFGSCATAQAEPTFARMEEEGADALILLGDTPYCDNSSIPTCRRQQRDFLSIPPLAAMLRKTPMWSTWDDHDFGFNDSNGLNHPLKANNRQVFTEYRAQESFGTGTEGVYTRFSTGDVDVFMIDARWFSRTAPSPADPEALTALGSTQWQWLLEGLLQSRATFKVLVSGMVWDDKGNAEIDDWYTYYRERDALFDFIRDQHIGGVVFIAGDVHVSRHVVRRQRIGYDLNEFVTSPLHSSVIPSLDPLDLNRVWGQASPNSYLRIAFDSRPSDPTLTARFLTADGTTLRTVVLHASDLESKSGTGLARQLRAYWTFDDGGKNSSALGPRLDLAPRRGASTVTAPTARPGGACTLLSRSQLQYWVGTSPVLPETAAAMTISLWFRPSSLPVGGDRMTLCQSTYGRPIDLFLSPAADDDSVAVSAQSMSASGLWIGPATTLLPRNQLPNDWTHLAVRYDGSRIALFVNGLFSSSAARPTQVAKGLSADAGFTIGATWNGVSTFNGMIDEVAVWDRTLSDAEILSLYSNGSPPPVPTGAARPDTDHDGLPDDWERNEGLDPFDPLDATLDDDGDGMTNLLEFALSAKPRKSDPCPCEAIIVDRDGEQFPALLFPKRDSASSLSYVLERSDDLVSWEPDYAQEVSDSDQTQASRFEPSPSPVRMIKASSPVGGRSRQFMRLRVINGPAPD